MADKSGEKSPVTKDPFGFTKPFEDSEDARIAGKVAQGLVTPDDDPISSALGRGFRLAKQATGFLLPTSSMALVAYVVAVLVLGGVLLRLQIQDDGLEIASTVDLGEYDSVDALVELPDGRLWATGRQAESWVWSPGDDDAMVADFDLKQFGVGRDDVAIFDSTKIVVSDNGGVRVLDIDGGQAVAELSADDGLDFWSGGPLAVSETEIIAIEPRGRLAVWSKDSLNSKASTFETEIVTPTKVAYVGEQRVVVLDVEGGASVVDLETEQIIALDNGVGESRANHLEVLRSGSVAVGYSGGAVRIWDPLLPEQRPIEFVHAGLGVTVESGAVEDFYKRNPDISEDFVTAGLDSDEIVSITSLAEEQVAVATYDGTVRVWSAANPRVQPITYPSPEEINQPRYNHVIQLEDGRIVAASLQEGEVKVMATNRFQPPETFEVHESGIVDLLLLTDGRIVSADRRAVVQVWNVSG